jgi:hypothetical protein
MGIFHEILVMVSIELILRLDVHRRVFLDWHVKTRPERTEGQQRSSRELEMA